METTQTKGHKQVKLARFSLMPYDALYALAEHYGRGAGKYPHPPRNWEHGYEWSKTYDALQRHSAAFWQGEDLDPESGAPHAAAVAWHALALLTYWLRGQGEDDRPSSLATIADSVATGRQAAMGSPAPAEPPEERRIIGFAAHAGSPYDLGSRRVSSK